MKRIFKSTIIFAVCLTLAACGTGSPRDITVQSITEPIVTQQTVNVPETTAVTESSAGTVRVTGTEDWVEPAATEPDDPNAGVPVESLTGTTFPGVIDDWEHAYIIEDIFYMGLPVYHWSENEPDSNYTECEEYYKKLLVEVFLDYPDNFSFFGGAYWRDGRMVLMLTDVGKKDELFPDLEDIENAEVVSCKYSYPYLIDVGIIAGQNEKVKTHLINAENNRFEIYGEFTDEDKENIAAEIEAAGYDPDAVEFIFAFVEEVPTANPC